MKNFIWPIRVYYEDTDVGGFVYHTNYLKFMERARTEWLREMGFDQTQLKQHDHLVFVVRKMTVDYLKPALFNDLLLVKTYITRKGKASLTMSQEVVRGMEVLCKTSVKLALINVNNQRPRPIPTDMLTRFNEQITCNQQPQTANNE